MRRAGDGDHAIPRPERIADLHVLGAQARDALGKADVSFSIHGA
jgi:hypothetical protein